MISCHETNQPVHYETTIETAAAAGDRSVWVGANLVMPEVEPRTVEILTVLNDVFDSFGIESETAILG